MRKLVASNHLPDFAATIEGDQAVFYKRNIGDGATAGRHTAKSSRRRDGVAASDDNGTFARATDKKQIRISQSALDEVLDLAPGWDRYALEAVYCKWAADKGAAQREDARFRSWVKSFTKGKQP